jgi:hypothetical protein
MWTFQRSFNCAVAILERSVRKLIMQIFHRDVHCVSLLHVGVLLLLQQPSACEDAWCHVSTVTASAAVTETEASVKLRN